VLAQVCKAEAISYDEGGLEALIFTAEGDLRNALNNLQSTFAGFGACARLTAVLPRASSPVWAARCGLVRARDRTRRCAAAQLPSAEWTEWRRAAAVCASCGPKTKGPSTPRARCDVIPNTHCLSTHMPTRLPPCIPSRLPPAPRRPQAS
jgi:hypothetical protein